MDITQDEITESSQFEPKRSSVQRSANTRPIFPALDAIRFLAAMIVAFYHLVFWRDGHLPDLSNVASWFWRFGWVGVEIFFTLSGIVIALSAKNSTPAKFFVSRAVRIAPTVWICATLTLCALLFSPAMDRRTLFMEYFSTLVFKPVGYQIDVVYWTLTVEIVFYSLVFACLALGSFRSLVKTIVVIGVISTIFNAIRLLDPALHQLSPGFFGLIERFAKVHTSNLLLFHHGCFFALGVLIWSLTDEEDEGKRRKSQALIFLFLVGGTMQVWVGGRRELLGTSSLAPPVLAWLIGFVLIFLATKIPPQIMGRPFGVVGTLRFLGLLTFPIYLLHNRIGLRVEHVFHDTALSVWVALSAVIVLSSAVVLIVEPPLASILRKALLKLTHSQKAGRIMNFGKAAEKVFVDTGTRPI